MLRLLLSVLLLLLLLLLENLNHVVCSPIRDANTALQEDWLIAAWKYMEANPETLEELMSDTATTEGDLILSSDRNAVERTWPTPDIPYAISPELAGRTDDILAAMAMVSEQTCVKFFKRTNEMNYLLFKTSKGCSSYVGFIGGEQPVFVGPPCRVGNIAHEILHALGFHHEHTRIDREQHVTVLPDNIMTGMERNFKKHPGQTFNLSYDVGSILHYGSGFFSANGLPTIVSNNDVKGTMGQRTKMTETDVQRVRQLYNCDVVEQELKADIGAEEKTEDWSLKVLLKKLKKTIVSAFKRYQDEDVDLQSNTPTSNSTEAATPNPH